MSTFNFSESLLNSKLVNDFNQDSDQELHQQWQKNVDAVHNHHNKARKKQSPFLRALHRRIPGHMRRLCSHQRQEEDRRAEEYRTRRMWGSDGRLPSEIRYNFTEGQRAILRVIAEQVKKCARCTLSVRHIAGMAGIKSRLVQYTLRRAQGLGLIRVDERRQQGNRNLTNIVWIICEGWLDWIGLGKKRRKPKGGGCTDVHSYKKDPFQNSEQVESKAGSELEMLHSEPEFSSEDGLLRGKTPDD